MMLMTVPFKVESCFHIFGAHLHMIVEAFPEFGSLIIFGLSTLSPII